MFLLQIIGTCIFAQIVDFKRMNTSNVFWKKAENIKQDFHTAKYTGVPAR
jgi:hypothetical protein